MWLLALDVVAILILVSSPCNGTEKSETVHQLLAKTESPVPEAPASTQATRIFPRRVNDDSVTYNVGDTSYVSLWDKLLYVHPDRLEAGPNIVGKMIKDAPAYCYCLREGGVAKIKQSRAYTHLYNYDQSACPLPNTESTEEQQGYNTYYSVPSTVNFHDIYSNSLALLAEDPVVSTAKEKEVSLTTMKDDKSFHLNTINTHFVEFYPKRPTIPPPIRFSPPMYLLNSSYIETNLENTTTLTTSTTTEEPEEVSVEVIPIKKRDYQRGLLDLLFPAARVRTFKAVFDTFRRIMSHTFR